MNASQFRMMCRFEGGKPGLYFRDHIAGRIKVLTATGEWIATVIPGEILGELMLVDSEAVVLSFDQDSDYEWRVSYGEAAALISALQQGGWDAVDEVYYAIMDAGIDLDF